MSDWVGNGAASDSSSPVDLSRLSPLERAKARLVMWEEALDACSTSQSYTIDGRTLTRAHVSECRKMVRYYENEVARLSAGRRRGPRTVYGVPRNL